MRLVATGVAVGLTTLFDPQRSNTYCRICGAIYQTDYDREPERFKHLAGFDGNITLVERYATSLRKFWSIAHSKTHTEKQHSDLMASGHFLTPEAAYKLAPFGVVDIVALVISDEHASAYREAPRAPKDDAVY